MKRLLTLVAFFVTIQASAQQVNPVPDYVFANRMSAGRNTVTDTAAYFSIGPRYGATRGMMPPMVVDTASFSANKRNGLLIFSVQKNKFLYWDSVGVKWAEMAGTGGSAITGSGVAGYMPEFTTTTNLDTTRLYHSAGRFAIGSTTTSNGVFNVYGGQSYFDTSLKVGSQTFLADEGKNEVYVNTTSDAGSFALQVQGAIYSSEGLTFAKPTSTISRLQIVNGVVTTRLQSDEGNLRSLIGTSTNHELTFITNDLERMRISAAGNLGIGTINPSQKLDVSGITRVNGGTIYAQASGTESGGYQLNALTLGYDATNSAGWITAGGAAARTNLVLQQSGGEVLIRTISDAGDYSLQVSGNSLFSGNIRTAAPSGGTANDWRLGTVASVSPTSPNRTIEVSIGGTIYYIAAKTTND